MSSHTYRTPYNDLVKIADIIHKYSGNHFPEQHLKLLDQRIQDTLFKKGCSAKDFIQMLQYNPIELSEFTEHITVNHTHFFRSYGQFEALETHVLPELLPHKLTKKINIWSAACSSGEEAYSLALYLHHFFKYYHETGWTFSILATDLDQQILKQAKLGEYSASALRYIDPVYRTYLKIQQSENPLEDDVIYIPPEIKSYVNFQWHNLLEPAPANNIDIIFCRNVLIYFDSLTQQRVITNLQRSLNRTGILFVSPSESISHIGSQLHPRKTGTCFYYSKNKEF